MQKEFNEIELYNKLTEFDFYQNLAYGLSCIERLYPNYVKFEAVHDWGDKELLRLIIDYLWNILTSKKIDYNQLQILKKKCDEIIPDTENFNSEYVSPALDASSSVFLLLEYVEGNDVKKITEVASLCRDTVDMYIQEIEKIESYNAETEKRILEHPLMQRELKRLNEDFEKISKLIKQEDFEKYERECRLNIKSNIDL